MIGHNSIDGKYDQFKREWKCKYPTLRKEMDLLPERYPGRYHHSLGSFAIFYTPIDYNPDFVLVGNNPSWFRSNANIDREEAEQAREQVTKMENGPPKTNLYMENDFHFARQMQKVFAKHPSVLDSIVGLNRFWLQTGGNYRQFKKDISGNLDAKIQLRQIEKDCEKHTREIVQTLNPKAVFLFGAHAQKAFRNFETDYDQIPVRHPANGGVSKATRTINEFFAT